MGAHAPGPEDAEKQKNGADNLANPTHGLKTIPADGLAREGGPRSRSLAFPGSDRRRLDQAVPSRPRGDMRK
jgi:hypothetical protein